MFPLMTAIKHETRKALLSPVISKSKMVAFATGGGNNTFFSWRRVFLWGLDGGWNKRRWKLILLSLLDIAGCFKV